MLGLIGDLALELYTDKGSYKVGESPLYTIRNAEPGSRVLWSSFVNSKATTENRTDYGNVIGPLGAAELPGGAWTEAEKGNWQKIAYVISPSGTESVATVYFTVSQVPATTTTPTTPSGVKWYQQDWDFDLFGNPVSINKGLAAAGIGLAGLALAFSGKRR